MLTETVQQLSQQVAALQEQRLQNPVPTLTPTFPVDTQRSTSDTGTLVVPQVASLLNVSGPIPQLFSAPALNNQTSQETADSGNVRIAQLMLASQFMGMISGLFHSR